MGAPRLQTPPGARSARDQVAYRELAAQFAGSLTEPGDSGYDDSRRIWNGSIDRRPGLIARCVGPSDVKAALRYARHTGIEVAIRGGGHSFPGHSALDDGLVIDLGAMKRIRIDPARRTVRAQPGVLLGELDQAAQPHGLAVPAGIVTHTGIAGLTLGGGLGWLMRKYGLTIDSLLSVKLLTATGEQVMASRAENAELFWGIRGGGGNFGVVTEFTYRLQPVGPTVLAGPIFWPLDDSPRVTRFYRDWIAEAPDELGTMLIHRKAPPLAAIPTELHGRPVVAVVCCYTGDLDEGERLIGPLRRFGSPLLDLCAAKPFVDHQAMFDPSYPHGRWYYFRSCDLPPLTDDAVDALVDSAGRIGSPHTSIAMFHLGGAVARVGDDDTAYSGRQSAHTVNIACSTETADGFDAEREWLERTWSQLSPAGTNTYVNFLMDEGEDRIRAAYGAAKYGRLQALKRTYDPGNLFHRNQNIRPELGGRGHTVA
ncbi:MAG TPA: FAD-binding oxidoreductase [Nocardioidaceae bacterium]|nr:FAD-binding oxidoreductase [Nocardioidaceae bacterium]